jgi:hypothetical protein
MAIGISIVFSLVLVVATVLLHYELLQFAGTLPQRLTVPTRPSIIIVISVVLAAHILEACLYAVAYYVLQHHFGMGGLSGHIEGDALDYLYFSMATYTPLGIGDLHPIGVMRLLAAVESLNGLVLIGWSASFTYLTMEEFWGPRGAEARRP